MSEPKLTWRRIDYRNEIYRSLDMPANFVLRLTAAINERMAELFPPAPQPEAKAEPDYSCHACGSSDVITCACSHREAAAAANARIAELVRERDEMEKEASAAYDRGIAKGAAAAKEACAKAVEAKADAENPFWFSVANMVARTIRETEVPGP